MADKSTPNGDGDAAAFAATDYFSIWQSGRRLKGLLSQFVTFLSNNAMSAVGIGIASSSSTALVLPAGTTAKSSLRLTVGGAAPSAPVNGDMWIESNTLKIRLNGATVTVTTA